MINIFTKNQILLQINPQIQYILKSLPKTPGVYQFYDINGAILYVGKAKVLKNRVKSYFIVDHFGKTRILVKKIVDIKYIIVETEQEALLLENSLIKKHQPPYNILLKDDKTFPWLCIKNEAFPRVIVTRKVFKDGGFYFGTYSNVKMMYTLVDLIKKLYPLRTCNYVLSPENIKSKKFKVCLEFHIGNCKGACENKEQPEQYLEKVEEIKEILKGNIHGITKYLKGLMLKYSAGLEFEKAQSIKEKLTELESYQSKYTVVSPSIGDVDVCSIYQNEKACFANFLRVINGAIVQGYTIEIKQQLEEKKEEILEKVLVEFNQRYQGLAKEVIVPFKIDFPFPGIKFTVPQIGDKLKLLGLSDKNARYFGEEKQVITKPNENPVLLELQKNLYLKSLPIHIECFDNSNIQGTNPMSACVVFKNGKPAKSDYRIFKIATVEGPNDFASMEEVVFRRYSRLLSENQPLPQLIIIDGGKGQLSSALKSLNKLGLVGKVAIVGIAKRLEEIYFPGDSLPIYIDKKSPSLKIIQYLRNEAHRFSLKAHRNSRSNSMTTSELFSIPGIGKATGELLLREFKSLKIIKEQTLDKLTEQIGKNRAQLIWNYFND